MKIITRIYILQTLIIGAIIIILMVLKLSSDTKFKLFLKSSHANNESMVNHILKIDKDVFMRPLRDNSEWDETVNYLTQPTREFEAACFNTLLTTFAFNHIWVLDKQGKQIYYVGDSGSENLSTVTLDFKTEKLLTPRTPFCHFFITHNNELIEIAGATIVPTNDTKHTLPASGYLLFGRNWDTTQINNLKEITGAAVELKQIPGVSGQSHETDSQTIACQLTDVNNNTVGSLVFVFSDTYIRQWERETAIFTFVGILIGSLIILIIGFLSRRWLVSPLRSIITALNSGENRHLEKLKQSNNEFGEMARLIEDSIITKSDLQVELKNKLEAEKVLTLMKNRAVESDRLKSAFLSNMSHEIRTPMNCILGFIQLLEQEDHSPEEGRKYMSLISSSGNQLLTIINDILDISRIESNQMVIQPVHSDLNELLENLLITFSREQQHACKNDIVIELVKGVPDKQFHIYCDRMRLEQVLNNLLSNALKFTVAGKITFGYSFDKEELTLFVRDTGMGISPENQKMIFERFRQEEESHTRKFGGTGLGLPISKGLIELMGGSMWLVSEKGCGATFYFTLPGVLRHDAVPVVKIICPPEQKLDLSGKTILVAEDVPENIELISQMLKATHVTILQAENGCIALNLCLENPSIDLVLMDIQMPVMNGYEATREIKKVRPLLPVIALTAFAYEMDNKNCLEAGCDAFLSKPFQKSDLLKKLIELLLN